MPNSDLTLKELNGRLMRELAQAVGTDEARAMARIILEDIAKVDPVRLATNPEQPVERETVRRVDTVVERVKAGEPLQYILGYADFHGLRLFVDNSVLIPRPETSNLVDIIADYTPRKSDLKIADICTGSGAIGLALARLFPFPEVHAYDISDAALRVAERNSTNLKVTNFHTHKTDILAEQLDTTDFDIVVSNPPYVLPDEAENIDPRVLDHEPLSALFAPSGRHPLDFYTSITRMAADSLKPNGRLYLEINPILADNILKIVHDAGFEDCELLHDYRGKKRFITASKP